MDAEGGGRLIYYDFGMMGIIPSDIRSGLLELFYGVYEKDSDRCIDALIRMGVLVANTDRTAVRRTADYFLQNFQVPCLPPALRASKCSWSPWQRVSDLWVQPHAKCTAGRNWHFRPVQNQYKRCCPAWKATYQLDFILLEILQVQLASRTA